MSLVYHHGFFRTPADVLDDVKANGTWPTTLVSGPSDGREPHWHAEEVHAYIMEGETDFLDAETGARTPVKAGDKIVVPARAGHAEGPVKDRVVYIIAVPEPLDHEEFLKPRPLEELAG